MIPDGVTTDDINPQQHTHGDVGNPPEATIAPRQATGTPKQDESAKNTVANQPKSQELVESNSPTTCLLYTSPSPRDKRQSRMPSSA